MSTTDDSLDDVPEDAAIEGFEPQWIDADGTRTRYYDLGDPDGEPLVLVHGGNWSGLSSANIWSSTFDHLAEHFRVIAYDRIGCGMTDNPDDIEGARYMTEIDHTLDFLDAMDLESVHICGSSRGAGHAARLAVEAPGRIDSLIMVNSGTFGPPTGHKPFRRDRVFERYKPEGFEATTPEYTKYRYEQYSVQTHNITDEFCRTNAWMERQPKAREMAETMTGDLNDAWKETMQDEMMYARQEILEGALDMPTLYICGRNDLMVPLEMTIAAIDLLSQENPDVRMHIIHRCGHLAYREHPEEFSQVIADFVDFWH